MVKIRLMSSEVNLQIVFLGIAWKDMNMGMEDRLSSNFFHIANDIHSFRLSCVFNIFGYLRNNLEKFTGFVRCHFE